MLTDIKLSKAQLSKIIQSGEFFVTTLGNVIGNLGKKAQMDLAVLWIKFLPKLATNATLLVLDKFERKKVGEEL